MRGGMSGETFSTKVIRVGKSHEVNVVTSSSVIPLQRLNSWSLGPLINLLTKYQTAPYANIKKMYSKCGNYNITFHHHLIYNSHLYLFIHQVFMEHLLRCGLHIGFWRHESEQDSPWALNLFTLLVSHTRETM